MTSRFLCSTRCAVFALALTFSGAFALSTAALANDHNGHTGMMPAMSTNTDADAKEYTVSDTESTHPILRLTPDKSEIVKLNDDAASLIIGNPAHLNILMDNPRTLIMVPRTPGATHFTVLNSVGRIVMQRHVIIASPKEDYIRVRRSCINGGNGCQDTRVYYCPDMCHEVQIGAGQGSNSQRAAVTSAQGADTNSAGTPAAEETAVTVEDEEPLTNESEADIQYDDDDSGSSDDSSAE
ncbi:MAG: pilus assembly protein N-terminal domain-containing protein [Micavibrio sp.]